MLVASATLNATAIDVFFVSAMKMLLSNGITARNAWGSTTSAEHLAERQADRPGRLDLTAGDRVDARPQRLAHERRRVDGERDDREDEEREADVEPGQAEDRRTRTPA